jgi:hypothetical protein
MDILRRVSENPKKSTLLKSYIKPEGSIFTRKIGSKLPITSTKKASSNKQEKTEKRQKSNSGILSGTNKFSNKEKKHELTAEKMLDPIMQNISLPVKQKKYEEVPRKEKESISQTEYFGNKNLIIKLYKDYFKTNSGTIELSTEPDSVTDCLSDGIM